MVYARQGCGLRSTARHLLRPADQQVLDDFGSSATSAEFRSAVDDLRRLFDVHSQCTEPGTRLLLNRFEVSMDPLDVDLTDRRLYLNVEALLPGGKFGRHGWRISLDRWITDEADDEGYPIEEHGEGLLVCELATRPKDFEPERHEEPGFAIKPGPEGEFKPPKDADEWVVLAERVRAEQDARPARERVYIGVSYTY